jgi:hypothetical protein
VRKTKPLGGMTRRQAIAFGKYLEKLETHVDPDVNLMQQLRLARYLAKEGEGTERELAELVLELDEWLRNGGLRPAAWEGK